MHLRAIVFITCQGTPWRGGVRLQHPHLPSYAPYPHPTTRPAPSRALRCVRGWHFEGCGHGCFGQRGHTPALLFRRGGGRLTFSARTRLSRTQQRRGRRGEPGSSSSSLMLPPPPWVFPNARVWYQPTFVPVQAARDVTPTSGLTLLSLFGWTLGGVFVVEWEDSPIGPYQEVAVLSGLVARGLSIGAWASHIVVTTDDAVVSGRSVFGLPARQGSIDFGGSIFDVVPSSPSPRAEATEAVWGTAAALAVLLKTAVGAAVPGVAEPAERLRRPPRARPFEGVEFRADNEVGVCGWDGWLDVRADGSEVEGWPVSLPSFSGLLPTPSGTRTPLLRYPLTLGPARRVRLRPAVRTRAAPGAVLSEGLLGVLGGPSASPCIQVDGVLIVAGRPVAQDLDQGVQGG